MEAWCYPEIIVSILRVKANKQLPWNHRDLAFLSWGKGDINVKGEKPCNAEFELPVSI